MATLFTVCARTTDNFTALKLPILRGIAAMVVVAMAITISSPALVSAASDSTTLAPSQVGGDTQDTRQALEGVDGILEQSDGVVTKSDADSALTSATADTVIDVPKDPEQGVSFGANQSSKIVIEMPGAENAGAVQTVSGGVVAFDAGDGSSSAVQATEDGGMRMLTVIDNPSAPTTYDYGVSVPNGGSVHLTPQGGAVVLDAVGNILSMIGTPWAKDADDKTVNTWFTTDGQTLTQHVGHNVPGVAYPVTADPFWIPAWVLWACGIGFLGGGAGYWVGGGTSLWRFLASGAVGCVFGIIGKKF